MFICPKENILHLCFETMVCFFSNIHEFAKKKKINNFQNFIHILNTCVSRDVYMIPTFLVIS